MPKGSTISISHASLIIFVLAVLSLPVLVRYFVRYLAFRNKLHRLKERTTVTTQYDAPINIPPAFFGIMLTNRLTIKEIAATILNLHLKDALKVEYDDNTKAFQIRLLPQPNQSLLRHEQYLISCLQPHALNGVIEAKNLQDIFKSGLTVFLFVVQQDLQIAGYYMFNPNITKQTPTAFAQSSIKQAITKGIVKPWNWPGYLLIIFEPFYGLFWLIVAAVFYNRIGIYNYKTKKWEEIWPDIEGYYNYLFEVEKQPRDYDLAQNPSLFKISVHDPYLTAAQIENNWMKIFSIGIEIGPGSDKDYKTL